MARPSGNKIAGQMEWGQSRKTFWYAFVHVNVELTERAEGAWVGKRVPNEFKSWEPRSVKHPDVTRQLDEPNSLTAVYLARYFNSLQSIGSWP